VDLPHDSGANGAWVLPTYLHRMGLANHPRYIYCPCMSDTTEHTLLQCANWDGLRADIRECLGRSSGHCFEWHLSRASLRRSTSQSP